MTTTYAIRVIHRDRSDDVGQLRQAMAAELLTLGLHRSVAVAVIEGAPPAGAPYACVILGDPGLSTDPTVDLEISEELGKGTTIFPVVSDLTRFSELVPDTLAAINGVVWAEGATPDHLVHVLLEELGIEDRQRRVFISHRREDGLGAAEQLHDRLSHMGFQPFIDRFSIREGVDVQRAIADALEDHAFVLVLETPQAHTSDWVYDELDYALSHTMGVLIVRWPGDVQFVPGSPGIPRLAVTEDELDQDAHGYDIFREAALDRLVGEIEAAHASGLVRRRRMLVRSVEESAHAAGMKSCLALADWRLLVDTPEGKVVVGTTPRLPTAVDLQKLDEASLQSGASLPGLLVHSARMLSEPLQRHLDWVSGKRRLATAPENAIGGWWPNAS